MNDIQKWVEEQIDRQWSGLRPGDERRVSVDIPPRPDEKEVGSESYYFWLGKDAEK